VTTVQASLRIRHNGCATRMFQGGTVMVQVTGQLGAEYFVLKAPEARLVREALAMSERYVQARATVLEDHNGAMVFRGVNRPDGVVADIRASDCAVMWPVVYEDGEEYYTLLAPNRTALRLLCDRLARHGDVEVERVADAGPRDLDLAVPLAELTAGLTVRQLGILMGAVRQGYYQVPRRAGSRALAHAERLSPSTWKEHLRKAERQVMERVGHVLARHAGLKGKGPEP
jgi:predicted DNA binding protein